MKIHLTLRLLGAALVASGATSCVWIDDPYLGGGGSGAYYGDSYGRYNTGGYPASSGNYYRSPFAGPHGAFYGGAAAGYGNHLYRDNYKKDDRIKLVSGSQRGKGTRPKEYHDREWYEKKGYDLSNYKHEHEHGGKTHEGDKYKKGKKKKK